MFWFSNSGFLNLFLKFFQGQLYEVLLKLALKRPAILKLSNTGLPKPLIATANGVCMMIEWGRKQVMGSVGSLR